MAESLIKNITFSTTPKNRPMHHHDCYQIIYIKKGSAEIQISHKKAVAGPGSFVFVNNLERHKITVKSTEYHRYTIEISPPALIRQMVAPAIISAFTDRPKGFMPIFRPDNSFDAENLVEILHNRFKTGDEMLTNYLLNSLLLIICQDCRQKFFKDFSKTEQVIYEIKRRIIEDPKSIGSLQQLSCEYHISLYHLSHSFTSITGCSPMRFLTLQRLAMARELLKNTDISITRLAENLGFSDINSFCRRFKKEMGCTPLQYRRQNNTD